MKQKKVSLEKMEQAFLKLTTHPLFLGGVGLALNASSYRKLIFKKVLNSIWNSLELPNRTDQEKSVYLLSELELRILKLEKKLAQKNKILHEKDQEKRTTEIRRPFLEDSSFQ